MASIHGVSVSPQSLASHVLVAAGDSAVMGDLSSSIPDFSMLTSDQKIALAHKMTADDIMSRHNYIMQQCASQAADLYRATVTSALSPEDVKMQMEGRQGGQTARIIVVDFTMPQDMQMVRGNYHEPNEAGINYRVCVTPVCVCACVCVVHNCVYVCCACLRVCVCVCVCMYACVSL